MVYSQKNLLTLIVRWSLFTIFLWIVFFSHIGSALFGTTPWSDVLNYSHLVNILIGPFWSALIIILLAKEGKRDLWVIYLFFINSFFVASSLPVKVFLAYHTAIIVIVYILEPFFKKEAENSLFNSVIFSAIYLVIMMIMGTLKALISFVSSLRLYGRMEDFLLGNDLAE